MGDADVGKRPTPARPRGTPSTSDLVVTMGAGDERCCGGPLGVGGGLSGDLGGPVAGRQHPAERDLRLGRGLGSPPVRTAASGHRGCTEPGVPGGDRAGQRIDLTRFPPVTGVDADDPGATTATRRAPRRTATSMPGSTSPATFGTNEPLNARPATRTMIVQVWCGPATPRIGPPPAPGLRRVLTRSCHCRLLPGRSDEDRSLREPREPLALFLT